jgi:hypothetical protein
MACSKPFQCLAYPLDCSGAQAAWFSAAPSGKLDALRHSSVHVKAGAVIPLRRLLMATNEKELTALHLAARKAHGQAVIVQADRSAAPPAHKAATGGHRWAARQHTGAPPL